MRDGAPGVAGRGSLVRVPVAGAPPPAPAAVRDGTPVDGAAGVGGFTDGAPKLGTPVPVAKEGFPSCGIPVVPAAAWGAPPVNEGV